MQFGDAVALVARGTLFKQGGSKHRLRPSDYLADSDYRDRLELKSASDRTLGVGAYESDSTLLMLTASTMMRVVVDVDKIDAFDYE